MDEMGLVVVAAIKCYDRPVDIGHAVHQTQNPLETLNTAERLGSEPDLISKYLNEPAMTKSNAVQH